MLLLFIFVEAELDEPCYFNDQCAVDHSYCCAGGSTCSSSCSCIPGYANINGNCVQGIKFIHSNLIIHSHNRDCVKLVAVYFSG